MLVRKRLASRRTRRSCLSCLTVPGDDARKLAKAAALAVDEAIDGPYPAQVPVCDEVYAPTEAEVERARRILAVEGVARLDGEMVDEANRRMAEAILARLPSE